nr:activating signal cointegrator 1 complex subunit 2 homolog [Leptinotarsa decemlineata]
MLTSNVDAASASTESDEEFTPLRCWDCNVNFTNKHYLYAHLFHHIKQPHIILERTQLPPLKITLKNKSGNSFEIISSPTHLGSPLNSPSHNSTKSQSSPLDPSSQNLSESASNLAEIKKENTDEETTQSEPKSLAEEHNSNEERVTFSPGFDSAKELGSHHGSPVPSDSGTSGSVDKPNNSTITTDSILNTNSNSESNASEYGSIPGAEPTPPPEPTVDYPKIRIKTTGLLKESLTITEITDDNPDGDPSFRSLFLDQNDSSNLWSTPSLEDPLKLPDNDDNSILSLFNNNERAKDLGFHSSDNEFISLDRLEERNRGAMQLYNSSSQASNPLDSLTGLPMQALAQQVSRLQPSGNGMHQQNVLINIQQFPSGPPQPSYQPPPMYPYPPQPMHQPYQYHSSYRPPNPMYYPPGPPGYPPQHMPPPPQPQLTQLGQTPMNQQQMGHPPMNQPPMNQNQMPPTSQPQNMNQPMQQQQQQQPQQQQSTPYRQPMPPRQIPPRPQAPGNRMPNGPRPTMGQRQPLTRQRAPMMRPRSGVGMTALRTVRPRMPNAPNGIRQQPSPVKRTPEQMQQLQAKKKRFDMLTPDKDDDDCQVICMQPKNTDGGLPQIESVQGGTPEPAESSIMHLSDSITLSVRNPPPKPASPKKSDAKAVANILATRGITVTATAKPKEKVESPQKSPTLPSSLNLNGAVSIIPAAKSNGTSKPTSESLPTVDLTDDTGPAQSQSNSPQKQRPGLPYRCDLCPAQYPNAMGLNKHRQTYHKTSSGMAELGIPLVNLKTPGILQKLTAMGINNYIPLPSPGVDGTFALPVINTRSPSNVANIGATTMLSLGPIRNIPKPQNNINAAKQLNNQKS